MPDYRIELEEIIRDLFDDDDIQIREETTASDIRGWDSLNNVKLMVQIEKKFSIRFSAGDIVSLKNVGELLKLIEAKAGRQAEPDSRRRT